jgi:DNA-binding transcriptional regulator YiaG
MNAKRMSFAENLKAIRRREGYSQATAAELIAGLSTRSLQAWESGRQSPPLWAQSLVLEALGGAPYDGSKKPKVRPSIRRP